MLQALPSDLLHFSMYNKKTRECDLPAPLTQNPKHFNGDELRARLLQWKQRVAGGHLSKVSQDEERKLAWDFIGTDHFRRDKRETRDAGASFCDPELVEKWRVVSCGIFRVF